MSVTRYRKLMWLSIACSVVFFSLLVSSSFYSYGYVSRRIGILCGEARCGLAIASASIANPGWNADKNFGFRWEPEFLDRIVPMGATYTVSIVFLPLWIPMLIAGAAIAYFHRKGRLPNTGHCIKCGYNLNGNRSGVCPECGVPFDMSGQESPHRGEGG